MTWFRAGGAGIPSYLKAGMNAVLNKKFGTSTTYPPTGWPDDVNLMGPLPEKTVSGAIASFSDGADDVPVKSAKFYFLPIQAAGTPSPSNPLPITGWTGLTAYQFGKNMIDLSSMVDGYVNTNGTFNTNHSNGEMRSGFIPVKPNTTYYFSIVETTGTAADWVGIGEYTSNDVTTFIRRDSFWRFTTSENAKYIVVSSRNLAQATKIQLEVGNDPTTYEAYQAPTTYPVTWQDSAGTLYGGYVDATRGKVVKTHGYKDLGELSWVRASVSSQTTGYRFRASFSDLEQNSDVANTPAIKCTIFEAGSPNDTWYGYGNIITADNLANMFIIYCADYSNYTNEEFTAAMSGIYAAFPLATPEEYDITAFIPSTYLGSNNFYSDANGDTEITYMADISLLLASLQSNRSLSMMRTISPEEVEQVEEEPEPEEPEER